MSEPTRFTILASKILKRIHTMTNEMKFAETVILVDAAYLDRVTGDLSKHFSQVVGRTLASADLAVALECLCLDGGVPLGQHAIQVLFIYDEESRKLAAFQPSDLVQELNNVGFQSQLGEFSLFTFEPSDMATREELFLESLKLVADAQEVKRLLVVPAEEEYGDKVPAILNKVDGKEQMTVFGMNPPADEMAAKWEMLGFALLQALGIKAEEL